MLLLDLMVSFIEGDLFEDTVNFVFVMKGVIRMDGLILLLPSLNL